MIKPKLYIMVGLPYSGKTTSTNELVRKFGFVVSSVDNVTDEKDWDSETMSQEDWNTAYSEYYEKAKKDLREGKSVVLDCGNLKFSERETARQIAKKARVEAVLIYVNISKTEVKNRWLKNATTKEREQLDYNTLNRALEMFEEPTTGENPIIYNQSMNLDNWLRANIS